MTVRSGILHVRSTVQSCCSTVNVCIGVAFMIAVVQGIFAIPTLAAWFGTIGVVLMLHVGVFFAHALLR
jgi:hypothetical protein